jgi:putative ABC transport system permease protein
VNLVALKMLVGDRGKYIAIVMGLTFAATLITQQGAIFLGFMTRTYAQITDTPQPDVWVMDREVEFNEDIKRIYDKDLYRVRGVEGIEWAVPLFKGFFNVRLDGGRTQSVTVVGIDDASLIGGPPSLVEGKIEDIRRQDGIIVDAVEAARKLARKDPVTGQLIPLRVGDVLEINDHRTTVVGLCRITPTFYWQPVLFTTYQRAKYWDKNTRRLVSYVLVKAKPGVDPHDLCRRIERQTGLAAYTGPQFANMTMRYVAERTGIAVNFGIAIALGVIVGTAIAGQTFYSFTVENIRHFGVLKAMGAGDAVLTRMIVLQALVVGFIGYGLGVGAAALFGEATKGTELAFYMPWQLLVVSAVAIIAISVVTALISVRKVVRLEPAAVFKA